MKISKALKGFVEQSQKTDAYWIEVAKLQFAVGLEKQRRLRDMTYKAIAEKMGTSGAYISKIFKGDSNVTIESMVKLARATGGHLDVRIVQAPVAANWDLSTGIRSAGATGCAGATVISFPGVAANVPMFERVA